MHGESITLSRFRYWKRIAQAYVFGAKSSNVSFWHTPLRLNRLGDKDVDYLRAYPQNYEDKIGRITTTDKDGVIRLDYKGDLGLQYNPNAIAQLALGYYDKILAGEDCKTEFLTQAEYFLKHKRIVKDDVLLWEYNFPFENREYQKAPWRSALAQGQGISVCLRAYELCRDERYLEAAKMAFNSFKYMAREHEGGVLDDSCGYTWLEEYIFSQPNHVLNGFIWALWGVRDYAVYFNDKYAWELWDSCLKTLEANLHLYDIGFWTSYDLASLYGNGYSTMPTSIYYQNLHCVQMEAMYRLTQKLVFKHYSEKWASQLSNPFNKLRSQVWKTYFKLVRF